MENPNTPIINAGIKYVNGLDIQKTGNKIINLLEGAARDATNTNDIILNSVVSINGSVSGANGIDSNNNLNASTFYAVYVIGDSTKYLPTAGLLSLNYVQPTLPGKYDMYRRVGWILTDSSGNILNFKQYGKGQIKNYYYDIGRLVLLEGTATTFTNISLANAVPPINTEVFFLVSYFTANASNQAQFQIPETIASNGSFQFGYGSTGEFIRQIGTITIPCQLNGEVPSILYKVFSGDTLILNVIGYTDFID